MGVQRKPMDNLGLKSKVLQQSGADQTPIYGGIGALPAPPQNVPEPRPQPQNVPAMPGEIMQDPLPIGNRERNSDLQPNQAPTFQVAPGGVPRAGLPGESAAAESFTPSPGVQRATSAPSMPTDPSPIAMSAPQPFTPMSPPAQMEAMTAPSMSAPAYPSMGDGGTSAGAYQSAPMGVQRKQIMGSAPIPSTHLMGHAGGLLGGGLGVPAVYGGGEQNVSALIEQLLRQAQGR